MPKAIYVHIPFCIAKCGYCDFNSHPIASYSTDEYVAELIKEIEHAKLGDINSIYFGGGTPTALDPSQLNEILGTIAARSNVSKDAEITVEANPGTIGMDTLRTLLSGGFNRISIGAQSFIDAELTAIGRIHSADEARQAFATAREAGFNNINIDLISALPNQTLDDWLYNLDTAIQMKPNHISCYSLMIEEGAAFFIQQKSLNLPNEDVQVEMLIATMKKLKNAGYNHYEISNFAQPAFECRHNLVYWRNEAYFGFGAGAASYVDGIRRSNIKSPAGYIKAIREKGTAAECEEEPTFKQSLGETIMLGLRLKDGIQLSALEKRYNRPLRDLLGPVIEKLVGSSLLDFNGDCFRLTKKGLLLASDVCAEFINL